MQGIAMETKKQSRFVLFSELLHRQFRGADHRNADLSALWDEAGCSGRQNETPLFRSKAKERRFFFSVSGFSLFSADFFSL